MHEAHAHVYICVCIVISQVHWRMYACMCIMALLVFAWVGYPIVARHRSRACIVRQLAARFCLQSRNAFVDCSVACQLFVSLTTLHRAGRSWSALFPGILLADCQSSLRSLSTSARSVTLHSTKRIHISTLGV